MITQSGIRTAAHGCDAGVIKKNIETIRTDEHSALVLEASKTAEYKVRFGFDHVRGCQDNNPGSSLSAQPSFWTAPPQGTERDRERTPPRSLGGA